jgi:hypothetical protein
MIIEDVRSDAEDEEMITGVRDLQTDITSTTPGVVAEAPPLGAAATSDVAPDAPTYTDEPPSAITASKGPPPPNTPQPLVQLTPPPAPPRTPSPKLTMTFSPPPSAAATAVSPTTEPLQQPTIVLEVDPWGQMDPKPLSSVSYDFGIKAEASAFKQ